MEGQINQNALDEQLAKFPMRFTTSVIVGPKPQAGASVTVNTGSAVLVDLGKGPIAITCQHVVAEAMKPLPNGEKKRFQVGGHVFDLNSRLIDQSEELDIATVQVDPKELPLVLNTEEIGALVFKPASWPPEPPKDGDVIAFGGLPGSLRNITDFDEIEFGSWSTGGAIVNSSSDRQFLTHFERENWLVAFGNPHGLNLVDLGGMSGGPAFILRGMHWDLVGIVKEYHEVYDAMFFASLRWVQSDGSILYPAA